MRPAIQRVEQAILLQGPTTREVQALLQGGGREIWHVGGVLSGVYRSKQPQRLLVAQ